MDSVVIGMDDRVSVERTVVRQTPDGRLTRRDAARYIGVQEKTLAKWAMEGRGPRPVRVSNRVFYWLADCDRFIRGE
jgi:hypothetical protein